MANGGSKPKICEGDMAATLRTLHSLSQDLDLFRSPSMKILRAAIQPLIEEQLKRCKSGKDTASAGQVAGKKRTKDPGPPIAEGRDVEESSAKIRFGSKVSLISTSCKPPPYTAHRHQVCEALRDKRWSDALNSLEGMMRQREVRSHFPPPARPACPQTTPSSHAARTIRPPAAGAQAGRGAALGARLRRVRRRPAPLARHRLRPPPRRGHHRPDRCFPFRERAPFRPFV